MTETVEQKIQQQIADNPILLYMKGSPQMPMCGFSARVAHILMSYGKEFNYVDVLQNPDIRATLPQIANWPTFPQLWVNGELIGGCDIVSEMHEEGELAEVLNSSKDKSAS